MSRPETSLVEYPVEKKVSFEEEIDHVILTSTTTYKETFSTKEAALDEHKHRAERETIENLSLIGLATAGMTFGMKMIESSDEGTRAIGVVLFAAGASCLLNLGIRIGRHKERPNEIEEIENILEKGNKDKT